MTQYQSWEHTEESNQSKYRYLQSHVYCSIAHNNPVIKSACKKKSACVSIYKWMDKENIVHVYNGVLFSNKEWDSVICKKRDRHIK